MPYRKYVRRNYNRYNRRYNRRRVYRRKGYRAVIPRPVMQRSRGIQDTQLVKLRYSSTFGLSGAGSALAATHIMSANGMYDPDITGVGHQPAGFDQWMAFYNHFTVIGAKIRVDFVSPGNTDSDAAFVGIFLSGDNTPITNPDTIVEQCKGVHKVLSVQDGRGYASCSLGFSAKKTLGHDPMSEDDNAGRAGANPNEQIYFHVWAGPTNTSLTINQLDCRVTVDYVAILHERKDLPQS